MAILTKIDRKTARGTQRVQNFIKRYTSGNDYRSLTHKNLVNDTKGTATDIRHVEHMTDKELKERKIKGWFRSEQSKEHAVDKDMGFHKDDVAFMNSIGIVGSEEKNVDHEGKKLIHELKDELHDNPAHSSEIKKMMGEEKSQVKLIESDEEAAKEILKGEDYLLNMLAEAKDIATTVDKEAVFSFMGIENILLSQVNNFGLLKEQLSKQHNIAKIDDAIREWLQKTFFEAIWSDLKEKINIEKYKNHMDNVVVLKLHNLLDLAFKGDRKIDKSTNRLKKIGMGERGKRNRSVVRLKFLLRKRTIQLRLAKRSARRGWKDPDRKKKVELLERSITLIRQVVVRITKINDAMKTTTSWINKRIRKVKINSHIQKLNYVDLKQLQIRLKANVSNTKKLLHYAEDRRGELRKVVESVYSRNLIAEALLIITGKKVAKAAHVHEQLLDSFQQFSKVMEQILVKTVSVVHTERAMAYEWDTLLEARERMTKATEATMDLTKYMFGIENLDQDEVNKLIVDVHKSVAPLEDTKQKVHHLDMAARFIETRMSRIKNDLAREINDLTKLQRNSAIFLRQASNSITVALKMLGERKREVLVRNLPSHRVIQDIKSTAEATEMVGSRDTARR